MVTNRVRKFRDAHEMTLRAVAEAVGVTHQTIYKVETVPDYNLSLRLAKNLARLFGTTVEQLFPDGEQSVRKSA